MGDFYCGNCGQMLGLCEYLRPCRHCGHDHRKNQPIDKQHEKANATNSNADDAAQTVPNPLETARPANQAEASQADQETG